MAETGESIMSKIIKGKVHIHLGVSNYKNFRHEYDGLDFLYNDGGRKKDGYKGDTGDCVTRSICIASGLPYQKVYDDLYKFSTNWRLNSNSRYAKVAKPQNDSPRTGVLKDVYDPYIKSLGFKWIPTMKIGSGCKVHLRKNELPNGRLIVRVSKHITSVVDKVINDTYDCSRGATRCVYGYYIKEKVNA